MEMRSAPRSRKGPVSGVSGSTGHHRTRAMARTRTPTVAANTRSWYGFRDGDICEFTLRSRPSYEGALKVLVGILFPCGWFRGKERGGNGHRRYEKIRRGPDHAIAGRCETILQFIHSEAKKLNRGVPAPVHSALSLDVLPTPPHFGDAPRSKADTEVSVHLPFRFGGEGFLVGDREVLIVPSLDRLFAP